jgi:hypothetical protein
VLSGVVNIGAFTISKVNLGSFVVGVVVLVLLTLFVSRTRLGLSMHAAAEDLDAARLMGIRIDFVVAVAFAIAAALAAIAGLFYAAQTGQINPYMGFTPVLKAFIAAVIGASQPRWRHAGRLRAGLLEVCPALFGIADIIPEFVPPESTTSGGVPGAFRVSGRLRLHLPHRPAAGPSERPAGRSCPRGDAVSVSPRVRDGSLLLTGLLVALVALELSGLAFWQGLAITLASSSF